VIILGINHFFHDSSACVLIDGKLVAALEEERFNRDKHTRAFPVNAINECLKIANISVNDIDHVAVSIKPSHRWPTKVAYAARRPHKAWPFIKHELVQGYFKQQRFHQWMKDTFTDKTPRVHALQHPVTHAVGSYFASPYDDAAILSLDGSGEWECAWTGYGKGDSVECYSTTDFPHSLGSVYEAVTEFCGFKPNYDEGKTMGLAPLGDASQHIEAARRVVKVTDEGKIEVDLDYFSYQFWGYKRCSQKFYEHFGEPRPFNGEFKDHHADVAAAFQQRLEECALSLAKSLKERTNAPYLVIAGGVALNSVMNGRLLREAGFDDVYIMPAAGDNGTSIGAAYALYHEKLGYTRKNLPANAHMNPYLGNKYDDAAIEAELRRYKLSFTRSTNICHDAAGLLEQGKIIGWFQGCMEIGPRALGSRSILANPAFPDMKQKINSEVKFREAYRPFAPSATVESAAEFFDIDVEAPFMLKVCQVREDKVDILPAITHVDGSARLQTVNKETHPEYHALITDLGERTGVPVVLNTSFNIQGEPVVESPRDAIRCFFTTGLDALCIGSYIISKESTQ